MAASRIYVNGLPRNITESDFRTHFSKAGSQITDAKVIPHRRIGFVGYSTPEDAQKAVKYFNKTFIRMSRLHVELATPPEESKSFQKKDVTIKPATDPDTTTESAAVRGVKRKRESQNPEEADLRLKEFLEVSRFKGAKTLKEDGDDGVAVVSAERESDDEYEEVPKKVKSSRQRSETTPPANAEIQQEPELPAPQRDDQTEEFQAAASDADWARSRTSRLLGLSDDEEDDVRGTGHDRTSSSPASAVDHEKGTSKKTTPVNPPQFIPTPPSDDVGDNLETPTASTDVEKARSTMRLLVRNLLHTVTAEDLESEFQAYGHLEEAHVVLDNKTRTSKGFAFLQFSDPDSAEAAMREKDGQTLQGRLMHILPAEGKRETRLNEFTLSRLPWKKQQEIKTRREAASKRFNWNSLYMNPDAVVSSVAARLGLPKAEVLDPTSSDAAVKQALAETHIIQETKAYFEQHGIDLNAFKEKQKGDTTILVKNIPYGSQEELKQRFEEHGEVKRFLMPPSGTVAIIEFATPAQGAAAFDALNHRRFKTILLLLEKAPRGLFNSNNTSRITAHDSGGVERTTADELKNSEDPIPSSAGRVTLFVGNLNFSTTSMKLTETFKPLAGFLSAVVKTKTDPKRPGEVLSMGYGFLEFRTAEQAQAAIQAMNGYKLDDHKLEIKVSRKGADAAEARRIADSEKKAAGSRTKIIIRNLAFEATKKDVSKLFGSYGQLRSVRVPRKMDRSYRGFAFADFTTPKEAQNAMDALRNTHLLGRKLVLEFAHDEPDDPEAEIEKMQQKVGAQVNKVALSKITSGGRKKFSTQTEDDDV